LEIATVPAIGVFPFLHGEISPFSWGKFPHAFSNFILRAISTTKKILLLQGTRRTRVFDVKTCYAEKQKIFQPVNLDI
jgi:hypothetical protein